MLILSFDFGTKNIGVAIGQTITLTANPLNNIQIKNTKPDWKKIDQLIINWMPKLIIVGYPLNMDGTKQKITRQAQKFAHDLYKKYLINIKLHDERLTTVESKEILFFQNGYKNLKKKKIDALSAAIILESWLQNHYFKIHKNIIFKK